VNIRLRKFPFPYRAALAVNNDTDGMTWKSFEDWHGFVNGTSDTVYGEGLGLEVADSFWVWSTNGEFALQHTAPWSGERNDSAEFNRIKELVQAGWLDTLHGMGDWRGKYQLNQSDTRRGFDLLDELGGFPSVYVNHGGGQSHGHNIGGPWAGYQGGDDPNHQSYCLPELLSRGAKYFWVDAHYETSKFGEELEFESQKEEIAYFKKYALNRWKYRVDRSKAPPLRIDILEGLHPDDLECQNKFLANSVLAPLMGRDGSPILGFKRYRSAQGPTSANFALQASSEHLDSLESQQGVCVIYQHFGVWRAVGRPKKHISQITARSPALDDNAVWAWRGIAERNSSGRLFVTTTQRLLDYLRMRDCLSYRVVPFDERIEIIVDSIECPVYGSFTPSIGDLNGLAFEVDRQTPEIVLRIADQDKPIPYKRAQDPNNKGNDTVYLEWSRLEFPELERVVNYKSGRVEEPKLSTPVTDAAKIVPVALTDAQITQWLNLSKIWKSRQGSGLFNETLDLSDCRTDLHGLSKAWGNIVLPIGLAGVNKKIDQKNAFGQRAKKIAELVPDGKAALDVGCGGGDWTFPIADHFDSVVGLDGSRENIDVARWIANEFKIARTQFELCTTPFDLPFESESFDFVSCHNWLGQTSLLKATLRELARVTCEGGMIHATLHGPDWLEHQRDQSKNSRNAQIRASRGIYTRECQSRWSGIGGVFSDFLASFYSYEEFRLTLAKSLETSETELRDLLGNLLECSSFNEVSWPAGQRVANEEAYLKILDKLMTSCSTGSLDFSAGSAVIEEKCGRSYVSLLANDLHKLFTGKKAEFTHSAVPRCYLPDEIERTVAECDLFDFQILNENEQRCDTFNEWAFTCRKPEAKQVVGSAVAFPESNKSPQRASQVPKWSILPRRWQARLNRRFSEVTLNPSIRRPDLQDLAKGWGAIELPSEFRRVSSQLGREYSNSMGHYAKIISGLTNGGANALDVGSSLGAWSFSLSEYFDNVVGLESKRKVIDVSKWIANEFNLERVEFKLCKTPFEASLSGDFFDFVVCRGLLSQTESLKAMVRELARVTRPNGLIYATLNGPEWSTQLLEDSKGSERSQAIALQGIYNTECQSRWAGIGNTFSQILASYLTNDEVRVALAEKLSISVTECVDLVGVLLANDKLGGLLPSAQTTAGEHFLQFLDKFVAAANQGPFGFSNGSDVIGNKCGQEFVSLLCDDLHQIFRGAKSDFSHNTAHRCYLPEEIEHTIEECNLVDFRVVNERRKMTEWGFICRKPASTTTT